MTHLFLSVTNTMYFFSDLRLWLGSCYVC